MKLQEVYHGGEESTYSIFPIHPIFRNDLPPSLGGGIEKIGKILKIMDALQRQQLRTTTRRMSSAVQICRILSSSHPSARVVLADLVFELQSYVAHYGSLTLQVSRDHVVAADVAVAQGTDVLVTTLNARNLAAVSLLPGIQAREVNAFVALLSQDRLTAPGTASIEESVWRENLPHIIVRAAAVGEAASVADVEALRALTRPGPLSQERRQLVLQALKAGPAATAALVSSLASISGEDADTRFRSRMDALISALDTLDRVILDEPLDDQDQLYRNLRQAHLLLQEPLRTLFVREGDRAGLRTTTLGDELFGPAAEDAPEAGMPVQPFDQRTDLTVTGSWQPEDQAIVDALPRDRAVLESLRAEVSETLLARDVVISLVDLMALEETAEEIVGTVRALAAHLPEVAVGGEFDGLALGVEAMRAAAAREQGRTRTAIEHTLAAAISGSLLDGLLAEALRGDRECPPPILRVLRAAGPTAVPRLIAILSRADDAGQRRQLCSLLADVCAGQVQLLGIQLPAPSWYLTRNLLFVLGELGDPAAIPYIVPMAHFPDQRVRRQAIDTLRKIATTESIAGLRTFFRDADPESQRYVADGLGPTYDAQMAAWLLELAQGRDFSPQAVELKVAAMNALARMDAREARPALLRIARSWWWLSGGRRAVRAQARRLLREWATRGATP